MTPTVAVRPTEIGSENAAGNRPNITSRVIPPATPTTVAKTIIPKISTLCEIALEEPVTANAIVHK